MQMTGSHSWVCKQQLKIPSSQLHKKKKLVSKNLGFTKEVAVQKQGALEKERAQTSFTVMPFRKSQLELHLATFNNKSKVTLPK